MASHALLFDLDGTLIDSDPLHAEVYISLFAERGIEIDHAFYFANVHGRHNSVVFREYLPDEDPFALHELKEAAFRALLAREGGQPIAGVARVVDAARDAGRPIAVVTNAPRANAEASLRAIGLRDRFDTIIVGEECAVGKPDPAPYHAALSALGLAADGATAFEDSAAGIRSAVAAGIRTIGVRSGQTDAALRADGAAETIQDFNDPALGAYVPELEGALT